MIDTGGIFPSLGSLDSAPRPVTKLYDGYIVVGLVVVKTLFGSR